jgi:hypothetical protein
MRTVSIISIVYGSLGLVWAAVASIIIKLQKAILGNFTFPDELNEYMDINAFLDTIYSMLGSLFPFVFLIAILFILSGILHLTGNSSFKTFIIIAAILNIIWYLAYMVLMQIEVMPMINSMELIPKGLMNLLMILVMLINAVFYCGYPIYLLLYIRKDREWDTLDTGYQN